MAIPTVSKVEDESAKGAVYSNIKVVAASGVSGAPKREPVYKFASLSEFANVHREATDIEHVLERKDILEYNKRRHVFNAWPVAKMPMPDDQESWLILVDLPDHAESVAPRIGEKCLLCTVDGTNTAISVWWTVERVDNRFGDLKEEWKKLVAFKATIAACEPEEACLQALITPEDAQEGEDPFEKLVLGPGNSVAVNLHFQKSDATYEAEIGALEKLVRNAPGKITEKQKAACQYLMDFGDPATSVDMFDMFPHMSNPSADNSTVPDSLQLRYKRFDDDQRRAYDELLANMPCGLAILPGGPGAGKTDWAMTAATLMQSKTNRKVLYLLDINKPLDDTTAKYVDICREAGMGKSAIRMKSFGAELKNSKGFQSAKDRVQKKAGEAGDEPEVDFTKNFMAFYTGRFIPVSDDAVPTLDQAAWEHYEERPVQFQKLTTLLESAPCCPTEHRALKWEIYHLYKTVLRQADFVATTPCVASGAFAEMYEPDLIVFDEAAHARELSTLIAVANFSPSVGWIFIGDHRQTQPTVKYAKENHLAYQLAISTMERAHRAGAIQHELLINHRAFGNLERLASRIIYDGKMKSGMAEEDRFPKSVRFVQRYLETFLNNGEKCDVPRLVVHISPTEKPSKIGTSLYHKLHIQWTMKRIVELAGDDNFRNAKDPGMPGKIILLSPYRAATIKYGRALEELAMEHPKLRIKQRVEARTWDTSQGHEADIIGIDYVNDHPTDFMDGMHRFNVGLTRARQGEWHLMHPTMKNHRTFQATEYLSKLYRACGRMGLDGQKEGHIAISKPDA